jgi:glycosyltransferase involved in cell wall biosynthesis
MEKKLKIISPHPVQYQVPLWRQLRADGWKVDVAYYHPGTSSQPALDEDFGIEIQWDVDLLDGYPHVFFNQGRANFSLREQAACFWKMLSWLLADRNVPVLFMGWFAESIWTLWLVAVLLRRPHLIISETTPGSFYSSPKPRWRVSFLQWLLKNTPACLYIGKLNLEFLLAMGVDQSRLFHAPYSIDVDRFFSESTRLAGGRAELRRLHGMDPALPAFLFCGKLIEKKRPMQLLQSYRDAGLQKHAQLIFVGEGPLRPELEGCIQSAGLDHVHVIGFLNQSQMPLAYVLGDVLCLPSGSTETWGLVVNEAMACGLPILISESVGCAPDLVDEDNGWRVPFDDRQALVSALKAAFDLRQDWRQLGDSSRQKISGHTFKAMSAGIQQACDFLAGAK